MSPVAFTAQALGSHTDAVIVPRSHLHQVKEGEAQGELVKIWARNGEVRLLPALFPSLHMLCQGPLEAYLLRLEVVPHSIV